MKQIPMWKVEIEAETGDSWENLFTMKPSVGIIRWAVETDIGALQQNEDEDGLDHFLERLHTVLQVAELLGDNFVEESLEGGWLRIYAAKIGVGAARVETFKAFQVEEPA